MSIKTTLKKAFGILSDTHDSVESPLRGSYSETTPGEWITEEKEKAETTISEQVQETPMYIRGSEEKGYYLVLGDYKLTNRLESLERAREIAQKTDWKTTMNVIAVMVEIAFRIEGKTLNKDMTEKVVG